MQHKINIQPVDDNLEPVQSMPDRSDLSGLYVRGIEVTKEELQSAQEEVASSGRVPGVRKAPLFVLVASLLTIAGGLVVLLWGGYL